MTIRERKISCVNPEQCAGIEDAKAGVDAINAANEISIGIGNKDILKQADIVFSNTEKLTLDNIIKYYWNTKREYHINFNVILSFCYSGEHSTLIVLITIKNGYKTL
ncbi:hypothetical protein DKP74_06675 [Fructilactobacillus sanfranciscensis]|uniref:hypothetical protein n=1 Tax=Fructilactobacillus sanfranciscensis TaxID=1625 RepID=UPI00111AFCA8|nr:hypothetical protein [Fructilactobacillus sanfranciscensis]TNK95034.1 hypothetical protein DKP74_06675 [Fructilactobacillus sanfranciscensis]